MELTVFDQIIYQFETIATGGIPRVRALVLATFWLLATIDACMAFLTNLEDGNHFKILIQKCLKIGFWLFMLNEWGTFCDIVLHGFIQAGSVVGSGARTGIMQHPSQIVLMGISTLDPILEYEKQLCSGWTDVIANLPILLAGILSFLFGCLAYIILGIQIVLTYVEFLLVCALFTLFVPFGVTRWTSFLAEKAIGGVIGYGVKLMVLSCILSIIPDVIGAYPATTITDDNALTWMVSLVAVAMLLAFLAWSAPGLAAAVMTGGPALTAGGAAGVAAGAAIGTAAVVAGGAKAAALVGGKKGGQGNGAGGGTGGGAADAAADVTGSSSPPSGGGSADGGSSSSGTPASPQFSGGGASSYDGGSSDASSGSDGSAAPPAADTSGSSGASSPSAGGGNASSNSSSSSSTASKAKSAGAGAVAGAAAGSAGSSAGTAAAGSAGGAVGGAVGSVAGDAAGSAAYDSASSSDAKSSSGSPASPSGAPPSQPSGNSQAPTQANPQNQQQKQPAFSNALSGAMLIKNSIPSEAGPHGSMNAPIRD
ncbi:P-type conjugative transfer protein TrbL [Selenomonas sp.]|uniref:P-type conjugative transfer protein TrbL n=1 Tax=Selenomonas sp. TaxID=2053611 RepID=UPI002A750DD8|nr:P-type conjugative transfer protein TrbL [Selenomonas sp.]MDY3298663.1 P-type conjugative transfer protein TrbL [Selenomonas sp.]